jgi:hypothetical protein
VINNTIMEKASKARIYEGVWRRSLYRLIVHTYYASR